MSIPLCMYIIHVSGWTGGGGGQGTLFLLASGLGVGGV